MWFFGEDELLLLHYKLIERFSGSHGVKDLNRLKSVIAAPKTSYYKTVFDKAAVYSRNIICDHPFIDGNKRTGIMTGVIFLEKNDIKLEFQKKELEDFAVKVATKKLSVDQIANWLDSRVTK